MKKFLVFLTAGVAFAATEGQLDSSRSLFSVMSAVIAASPDSPSDELRAGIRKAVLARSPAVLPELRTFLYQHRKPDAAANIAQYVSFALNSQDPPQFVPVLEGSEAPPDVQPLGAFRELMARFHQEAAIDELWAKLQPAHEAAIARHHEPVSRALLEANAYLRNPTSGYMGRRFQVFVDLIGPPNQVHTRSYKDDYFIVVTPSAEPRIADVRHAYLHYLLDPLATKYTERIARLKGLGDYAQGAPALEESYKADFLLLTVESLIKAIEARLDRKPSSVPEALAEGFVLAPYFYEQLPGYEKQDAAMRLFLPEMLDSADLKKEDRRLQQVKFASTRSLKTAPAAAVPVAEPAIEAADKLYAGRELDKAREAYLAIIRHDDDRAAHARAYYGLARIAALRNEPDLAEQLFRKTLESSPDPHTHSWSEVYLGRLAEGFGERDKAEGHYKAALAISGVPPGARQAAEQALQKLGNR
ncbi:MAG TPA: tetratricopeptide repeat protein [Bryobacteraceae bacterium]|nr:tetratricopeptide repeat protein [Bryobacteraceae bacterium]